MRYQTQAYERRTCEDRRHEERRITRIAINEERRVGDRRWAVRRAADFIGTRTIF